MLSVSKNSIGGKLTPDATRTTPASWMSAGSIPAISSSFSSVVTSASDSVVGAGLASSGAAQSGADEGGQRGEGGKDVARPHDRLRVG